MTAITFKDKDGNVYKQEFDAHGNHRIVRNDSARTNWAPYSGIAHMDGIVSATGYFLNKEALVTSDEFCKQIAAC